VERIDGEPMMVDMVAAACYVASSPARVIQGDGALADHHSVPDYHDFAASMARLVLFRVRIEKCDGEMMTMVVYGTKVVLLGATVCGLVSSGVGVSLSRGLRGSFVVRSVPVGKTPQALAVDPNTGRVFVANGDSNTVSVLDARTGAVIRTTPVGQTPQAVAVDRVTGRAFVVNSSSNTVSVLAASTGRVVRTVAVGKEPVDVATDEVSHRAFVISDVADTVSVLDTRTGAVIRSVRVGAAPRDLAVDPGVNRVFVLDSGTAAPNATDVPRNPVSMLDARTGAVLRTFLVGQIGMVTPGGLAVDDRTHHLFVANSDSNNVMMVDTRTGTVLRTLPIAQSIYIATAPRAHHAFVLTANTAALTVVDTRTGMIVRSTTIPSTPLQAAVDDQRGRVVITSDDLKTGAHRVSMVDARTGTLLHAAPAAMSPAEVVIDAGTARAFVDETDANAVVVLDTGV